MAANYGTIKEYQKALSADTAAAITISAPAGNQLRCAITAPSSRTVPVYFIFRSSGSTEPTTVAAGADSTGGAASPCMKPGYPCEVNIPGGTTAIVLKSPQAGDVYVTIYEAV